MSARLRRCAISLALLSSISAPLAAQSTSLASRTPQPGVTLMTNDGVALRHRPAAPLVLPDVEAERTTPAPAPAPGGFASSGFAQFMSSPAGRVLRIVAGAGMIAGGIAADNNVGTGIAIAGAVPLLAGTFDFCVLSPLFGGPLSGKAIRAAKQ